jgi:integrase/recombinase XerD
MLEYYFKQQSNLLRLRRGPLTKHLDGLAEELHFKGYLHLTGQNILSFAGRLNNFARLRGITDASQVDDTFTERFLKEELAFEGNLKNAPAALMHVNDYLQRKGVIQTQIEEKLQDPDEDLLSHYDDHLLKVRGLTQGTRDGCLRGARIFLKWFREQHPGRSLSDLRGSDVLDFVLKVFNRTQTIYWKKRICCDIRGFFRYLRWENTLSINLDRVVPHIPQWRLAKIPRHLPWKKVRELIDSINTDTADGKRDIAIILLISTLGLRSKEVHMLKLSQIEWKLSEIRIQSTKNHKERILPLTTEVGEALVDYILNGRPKGRGDDVFMRHSAPVGPWVSAGSISHVIRRRLKQAGIEAPSFGAHMLRHSLATRMINNGISISNIADLLGHASIETTAIYAKVDVCHLASVALPFLGGDKQ